MDLGTLEGTRERQRMEREREQQLEEGENCQLVLQLPDGSQHSHSFKLGATVAYVKLQVQELYGVPMEKQLLQTAGRTLIDPLSLADCPGITPDASCLVVVSEQS